MQSINLDFLHSASGAGPGPVFQNERYNLLIAQIEGTFTGLSLILEGRTETGTGPWETISGWSMSDMDARIPSVSGAGIYEYGIENVRELRFRVLAITSGSVSAAGVLYDSASKTVYPYNAAPSSIRFGDPNLFVKGVAEQIFFDPSTGNIVGYDKTATEGAVSITANLSEITGGMGNQLIGVLPDTARVSGTYTSAAFSLETRERIMGGQIAYNAVAQVCETITADSDTLTVSGDPVPFFAEEIPEVSYPTFNEISDTEIASFSDGADNAPLRDLKISIEPVQSGSGDPSPSNVRPITGWTGAKVSRTGKNLLKNTASGRTYNGVTYSVNQDGSVNLSGQASATSWIRGAVPQEERVFLKAGTYTVSGGVSGKASVYLVGAYVDGTTFNNTTMGGADTGSGKTFTLAQDAYLNYQIQVQNGVDVTGVTVHPQLELGSTATAYEPYQGNTYDISWQSATGMVYGGTLDVTTGVLTVTNRLYTITSDLINLTRSIKESNLFRFYLTEELYEPMNHYKSGLCDKYTVRTTYTSINANNNSIGFNSGSGTQILIRDDSFASVQDVVNVLPINVCYPIAEPITYQLTPVQIATLLGENNVWADTGEILYLNYQTDTFITEKVPTACRCYVRNENDRVERGTAYFIDSESRKIVDYTAIPGERYEVTYFTHRVSAQMLPIPTVWNPVMMTVQERYGVYAKQGGSAERGILRGWLTFIVPRAILNADAGANGSQTAAADTSGNWIALPEKPENMPMCACGEGSSPLAYYVYVPCSGVNDAVSSVVSVGSGLTLKAGRTAQLPIKLVMPDDSLIQPDFSTLGFYSNDDAVAVVDNAGAVTAVSEGETVIHAIVYKSDGSQISCDTAVVVEGVRNALTANVNNILYY